MRCVRENFSLSLKVSAAVSTSVSDGHRASYRHQIENMLLHVNRYSRKPLCFLHVGCLSAAPNQTDQPNQYFPLIAKTATFDSFRLEWPLRLSSGSRRLWTSRKRSARQRKADRDGASTTPGGAAFPHRRYGNVNRCEGTVTSYAANWLTEGVGRSPKVRVWSGRRLLCLAGWPRCAQLPG